MSRITQPIAQVVADGRVTYAEWNTVLRPVAETLPLHASAEARELLALWASDTYTFEPFALKDLALSLRDRGYGVPRNGRGVPSDVQRYIDGNVTEPDVEFDRISTLAGRGDAEAVIAVVDSGTDVSHPGLRDKLWVNPREVAGNRIDDDGNGKVDDVYGWDFAYDDADVMGNRHGSHVTGIATRGTDRLKSMSVVAFDPYVPQTVADALEYAAKNGARVINMSFKVNSAERVGPVLEVIRRYPDVLFVKASGNEGTLIGPPPFSPDRYLQANILPNMVVVAASNEDGTRARFSNYGVPYTDVTMQGYAVFSTVNHDLYGSLSGTSMSSPWVMSVAGKMLAICPALSGPQLKRLLVETSDRRDDWAGLINAGGPVNPTRAMNTAAMIQLMREGSSASAAADRMGLAGEERSRLMALAAEYATGAVA
jgi:subtilisin family serine protease